MRNWKMIGAVSVAVIASCALLMPVKSYAQTTSPIVIVCAWSPGEQSTVTLDLAGKSLTDEDRHANPGGSPNPVIDVYNGTITQITDQQIDWVEHDNTFMYSLNRFTLDLHLTTTSGGQSEASCHKQEKQI